jgi:hypothetical protein
MRQAERIPQGTQDLFDESGLEPVMSGLDRRVRGENSSIAHTTERLQKTHAVLGHFLSGHF